MTCPQVYCVCLELRRLGVVGEPQGRGQGVTNVIPSLLAVEEMEMIDLTSSSAKVDDLI